MEPMSIHYTQEEIDHYIPLIAQQSQILTQLEQEIENLKRDPIYFQAERIEQTLKIPPKLLKTPYDAYQLIQKRFIQKQTPVYKLEVGKSSFVNNRQHNEDTLIIAQLQQHVFTAAVFDGHGSDDAAVFCRNNYLTELKKQLSQQKSLHDTFTQLDEQFAKLNLQAGATSIAFILAQNKLEVANAGDARLVMRDGDYLFETIDHKPNYKEELDRLRKVGGYVSIIQGIPRVCGQAAFTRSIGDPHYKRFGVTAVPDCWQFIVNNLKYIVLASDGLWDCISSQQLDEIMYGTNTKSFLHQAMKLYLTGEQQEGDQVLKDNNAVGDLKNAPSFKQGNQAETYAIGLTRIAIALGSQDNITIIVVIAK